MRGLAHNLIHINCAERRRMGARRRAPVRRQKAGRRCQIFTHGKITLLNQLLGWQAGALPTILSTVYVQNATALVLLVSGAAPCRRKPANPADMLDIYAWKLSLCKSSA